MAYDALGIIRPLVRVGSAIAPQLTGDLAFRAFCRPPRADGTNETQRKLIERAAARMDHAESWRLPCEGGEVQAYRFPASAGKSRGTVLLVHGWTGRAAFMSAFLEPLTAEGWDVVAIDLPGHGLSSGRALHVPLGVAALQAAHAAFGPFSGIVAHSFGGALATAFVSGAVARFPATPVGRLVLIATPSSMPELFVWFGRTIGLTERGRQAMEANVLRLSGRALSTFEGDAMLRRAGIPTLVLHAPDDKEVAFLSAERLASAGPHVALQALPGLGHRRILYAPQTVEAARAFLAER
jgi:pimeloyl-ACP methyl ester carboxylesterase